MWTKENSKKMLKVSIASYISFIAVHLFGFKNTTSIAFSAIMVVYSGFGARGSFNYAWKRMLAQVIGVTLGAGLYYAFAAIPFLPPYQKFALSMTIGLVLVLWIKYHFKLDIIDLTMFTPVFLALLMLPGNAYYPFLRLAYCLIGVIIGFIINLLLFPPKHSESLSELRDTQIQHLGQMLYDSGAILSLDTERPDPLDSLEATLTKADTYLSGLRNDAPVNKSKVSLKEEMRQYSEHHEMNKTCVRLIRELRLLMKKHEISEDHRKRAEQFLSVLLASHIALLSNSDSVESKELVELEVPPVSEPHELLFWAELIKYKNFLEQHISNVNSNNREDNPVYAPAVADKSVEEPEDS